MAKEFERRVPPMRGIDPALRGARLAAARGYGVGSIPRHAILNGHWDFGQAVVSRMQARAS